MEEDDAEVQQSAFGMIRQAILNSQWQVDLSPIMQKLTKLQESVDALQQADDDPDPEEDPDDPDEDPEENNTTTKEKAKNFFKLMFS